jgi:GntR family transcriptional regulator
MPLWAQVLGDLRARLARGEFTGRFPGDEELRAQYGVSRHTAGAGRAGSAAPPGP